MGGHHQAHAWSSWGQGNCWAIVKSTRHPTFRMDAHLIRYTRKRLRDHFQIQEAVVTTPGNYSKANGEDIDERSSIAIEPIQTKKDLSQGKCAFGRIAGDHLESSQQFPAVIPIAWSRHPCPEIDAYVPGG